MNWDVGVSLRGPKELERLSRLTNRPPYVKRQKGVGKSNDTTMLETKGR